MMPYTYEFDDTEAGDVEFEYGEYELLHRAYAALHGELADWNRRAKASGGNQGPYEKEEALLDRRLRWGKDKLEQAAPHWDPIVVDRISVGSLRYAKAALVFFAHQLRASAAAKRREGWPEGAALSSVPDLPRVENLMARIREDAADVLREILPQAEPTVVKTEEWDVFISHAHEDKHEIAEPLAQMLAGRGLRVWYDRFTLQVGMSLRRSIDAGLARSRFGVVILSPSFLGKEWPQKELDGLVTLESDGRERVLPIWHKLTAEEVRRYSPTLADKVAVPSTRGLEAVVDAIHQVVVGSSRLR